MDKAGNQKFPESRFILYAPSVCKGGGLVLLRLLLNLKFSIPVIFILNEELHGEISNQMVYYVKPSWLNRIKAEFFLKRVVKEHDIVLCFGNLPPLFQLKSNQVNLFIQNRHMLDEKTTLEHRFSAQIRFFLLKQWLKHRVSTVNQFIVQTPSMRRALQHAIGLNSKIEVSCFAGGELAYTRKINYEQNNKPYDFIYVATLDKHKQHGLLIDAWCILAEQGIKPNLCITVDEAEDADAYQYIQKKQCEHALEIKNFGHIGYEKVLQLYVQSKALIFPSIGESFGMPLLEARQAGLAILAPELDYVRDLVDPEQTFDPTSALSIARAVKRFLNYPEAALSLVDAQQFINNIICTKKT